MTGESNIERDRRKRSLIDTPPPPPRRYFGYAEIEPLFIGEEADQAYSDEQWEPIVGPSQDFTISAFSLEPDDLTITYDDGGPNRAPLEWEVGGIYSSDEHVDMNRRAEWKPGDTVLASIRTGPNEYDRREFTVGEDGHLVRVEYPVDIDTPTQRFDAPFVREFRTRPGKLKPGSLTENGMIVAPDGLMYELGPVIIRIDNLKTSRLHAIEAAGWQMTNEVGFADGMVMGTFEFANDWIRE